MERIIIEVSDDTAKNWELVPTNVKTELQKKFEEQIDDMAKNLRTSEFQALLDKMGEEARRNGLTEEILQQLLKDE